MILNIFLLLLVSHALGDAIFTSYRLAVLKRSQRLSDQVQAIICHSSVHALFAGLLLLILGRLWLKGALLVLAIHSGIDFMRCRVEMRLFGPGRIHVKRSELIAWISGNSGDQEKMRMSKLWPWFVIHLMDQGAHMGSLYGIALIV